jgi:hypothetical protein
MIVAEVYKMMRRRISLLEEGIPLTNAPKLHRTTPERQRGRAHSLVRALDITPARIDLAAWFA